MSINRTRTTNPSPADDSDVLVDLLIWALFFIVSPSLSIFGIIGNSISIATFSKRGLAKTSDILLFCLSLADFSYLCGVISIAVFTHAEDVQLLVGLRYDLSYLAFVTHLTIAWVSDMGVYCSLTFPVLIILERFVAIFFPLRFYTFINRTKTWTAVASIFIMYAAIEIYLVSLYKFVFGYTRNNVSKWFTIDSDIKVEYKTLNLVIKLLAMHISGTVPVVLVAVGTTVIGIKIKMALSVRGKMTFLPSKKDATTSKTTRSLLSLCLVYSIISGFVLLNDQFNPKVSGVERVLENVNLPLLCINSSCNYVIYVATNPNFRISIVWRRGQQRLASNFR